MQAYGWKAHIENEFYTKKNALLVKERGTDNFDTLTNARGDIELDCGEALFLYGGRSALLAAFKKLRKAFILQSSCANPKLLGVFAGEVTAAVLKSKRIIMIAPADGSVVNTIGEEYLYKYDDTRAATENLYDGITGRQLKVILDRLLEEE